MRKVIGIGETILDIIFKNNQPYIAVPGGSTFNGLISLGRLGIPVSFISEVGNDRVGEIIRSFMKENNLSTQYVNPWSFDGAIKYVLGEEYNVEDLWKEYLKAMGDIK